MLEKDRPSLGWILLGLYPFLFFGPVQVLLAYPYPFPAWRSSPAVPVIMMAIAWLPAMAGLGLGWWKRFPLWSSVYVCLAVLSILVNDAILLDGKWSWEQDPLALASLLFLAGLMVLLVILSRRDLPLQDLIQDMGSDWTRLSLGLLIVPAFLFGGIDHDEDPVLTIFVIAPTLVIALTAGAALLARTRTSRAWILAMGMLLTILVRLPSGKWFYLFYWLALLAIVFSPFWLAKLRFQSRTPPRRV